MRSFEKLKQLLVQWIVCCHIAFFQFENLYFRHILDFLYPGFDKYLPRAGHTVRKWMIYAWQLKKEQLQEEFREAL
jgi:hypothetical protein